MRHAGNPPSGTGAAQGSVPGALWHDEDSKGCCCQLRDGTEVRIRSIKTSDVAACSTMFRACTPKSLYSRYEHVIKQLPDRLAADLCTPDPECERTLVAEIRDGDSPSIIGVAQLIVDPKHETAEYAVLIADPWQNRGMGSAFTDVCLQLARRWGIPRVVAEFLPSNMRMIRILEGRKFDLHRDLQDHVVSAQKLITSESSRDSAECRSPAMPARKPYPSPPGERGTSVARDHRVG